MDNGVWLQRFLTVIFLLVALYCLARLATSAVRRTPGWAGEQGFGRDVMASHVLMALGMAAMFSPWDGPVPATAWAALFAAVAAWFAYRLVDGVLSLRSDDRAQRRWAWHHAVEPAAMAYMMLAMPANPSSTHSAMPGIVTHAVSASPFASLVTRVLLTYFVLFTVWSVVRVVRTPTRPLLAAGAAAADGRPFPVRVQLVLSPKLAVSCQLAIAAGMAYVFYLMR